MSRMRLRTTESVPPEPARSLEEVHERRGMLLRLAYRFCFNEHDAEDAVQNALLQAARKQHQLADREKLWPWVKSIVVRQCLDIKRRAARRRNVEQAADPSLASASATDSPESQVTTTELKELLRQMIARLPERQHAVLVLRHLEGQSYGRIAETLGMSESTARVQARNAREALRRMMLERYPDWAPESK